MRLASIHTYPIKGCHRLDHDGASVEPWGLAGDRRWMILDEDGVGVTQRETTRLTALRAQVRPGGLELRAAGLPTVELPEPVDGDQVEVRVFRSTTPLPARFAGPTADEWLGELLDRKVRLVWLGDPTVRPVNPRYGEPGDRVSFADGYPVLLANTASLDVLNGWIRDSGSEEGPLPMARFRPNLVVDGAEPWAEDDWLGRRLQIGTVVFRAVKPCDRCVVTTTDQETGQRGREPLRTLGRHRNVDQGLLFGLNLVPDGTGEVHVGDEVRLLP
ncbi:MOSC domain-containing protein [Micromonospora sonneratiae]|uniref:MOSC domain-containing protein n=1 Tax=Micromonospora sonneratiae TaxID=1184706 RepID=A0ABW3Y903_9ACTN